MLELTLGVTDGGKCNSDQSLLQSNVKKKIYAKSYFKRTFSICLEMPSTRH